MRGEGEKGLSSRASSPDRTKANSNPPATWLERFSPNFLSPEANAADLDRNTAANLTDNQAAIAISVERSPEYAILSIASGSINKPILIHNPTGLTGGVAGDAAEYIALHGMGRIASLVALNFKKAFLKRHNAQVLRPSFLLRNPTATEASADDTETISVINSVQIPPWLTREINTSGLESAQEILLAVRSKSIEAIEAQAEAEETTFGALLNNLEDDDDIPYGNLLRHLFD